MPFFYSMSYNCTSSSSANATTDAGKIVSDSTSKADARVSGVYVACYSTSAGGYELRVVRPQTVGTGGTTFTLAPRNQNSPAAIATASTANTTAASGTLTQQLVVGAPATGGMGGWIATDPDGVIFLARGGASTNGTATILDLCAVASVTADHTIEVIES